jgi:carbon-monoxide dehydrogenase small subunit
MRDLGRSEIPDSFKGEIDLSEKSGGGTKGDEAREATQKGHEMKRTIHLTVNNQPHELSVEPNQILLDVLRAELGLTGTKGGCHLGDCGSCTVIMDGKPVNSCLVLAVQANGRNILTVEGLADERDLHPIQTAFLEKGAVQCGFCTPGMLLSAKGLLDQNPSPSVEEIKVAISGNLCRCTGYIKIIEAIESASKASPPHPRTKYGASSNPLPLGEREF